MLRNVPTPMAPGRANAPPGADPWFGADMPALGGHQKAEEPQDALAVPAVPLLAVVLAEQGSCSPGSS